jgi:hypothetical protein
MVENQIGKVSISPPPQGTIAKIGYAWQWGKKFGFKELAKKPFQLMFAPLIIKYKKKRTFELNGQTYQMFYHPYNCTWTKERAVEIPLAVMSIMENGPRARVLEVGNVLANYFPRSWDTIDKYEVAPGVINEDIETFKPNETYDKIIAVSTFEHIGYDSEQDQSDSENKIIRAFNNLRDNCLFRGGQILITTPMGYNPYMDNVALNNKLGCTKTAFLKKINKNEWKQVSAEEASKCEYGSPYPFANCIFVGEYTKGIK